MELSEPVDGAAPGQLACLMDGELVVGWGTIAPRGSDRRVLTGRKPFADRLPAYTEAFL